MLPVIASGASRAQKTAVRATSSLRDRVAHMRQKLKMIAGGAWDRSQLETLIELQERSVEHVAKAPELSPLEANDREDELVDWFEAHNLAGGYDLAPTFVQAGMDTEWLDKIGTPDPGSMEESMLSFAAVAQPNSRLSCQITMREELDGLIVRMPEGQH